MGIGIAAMHYTGMSAYFVQGTLHWDVRTVVVSVVIGIVLGSLSMVVGFHPRRTVRRLAPLLLLAAVCGTHFIGMDALTISFDPSVAIPGGSMNTTILSLLTANATVQNTTLSGLAKLWFNPDGAAGGGSTVQLPQLPQPQAGQRQTWGDRIGRRRRAA